MEEFLTTIERHEWTVVGIALFILIIVGEVVSPFIKKNRE